MDAGIIISGLGTGAVYGLIALAYFLFTRATKAVNFAIGAFVMFAAMLSAYLVTVAGVPVAVATLLALAAGIALVWLAEAGVLRPIMARTTDEFGAVMAIVALMFVLEQLAGILFTRRPLVGKPFVDGIILVGDSFIEYHTILVLVVTVLVFAAVDLWLRKGRYGRMLRAVGDNEAAARVLGLPVRRAKGVAMVCTGLVCAVAGVLVVSYTPVNFHSSIGFAILGFVAFVIGGMGNAWAPLAGGLILGVIEALSAYVLGGGARDYVLLALVLVIFTVRPQGLFHIEVRL